MQKRSIPRKAILAAIFLYLVTVLTLFLTISWFHGKDWLGAKPLIPQRPYITLLLALAVVSLYSGTGVLLRLPYTALIANLIAFTTFFMYIFFLVQSIRHHGFRPIMNLLQKLSPFSILISVSLLVQYFFDKDVVKNHLS